MSAPMFDRLMDDMKAAMKNRDLKAVNTIRGVIARVKDLTVNAGKEMSDADVSAVLAKAVKQREESIAQFEAAGRSELAEGERAELATLKAYLPEPLSEAQLAELIRAVVTETGAASKKDMGRVMKEVMARAQGRADGKLVSKLVGAALP